MHLDDLRGRRVVLLGLGTDVRAAVPALVGAETGELLVVDDSLVDGPTGTGTRGTVALDAGTAFGRPLLDPVPVVSLAEGAVRGEVFVRSPGFPRYRPELVAARARGAAMTTPLDLWLGSRAAGRTVVAVTGTKGKSTVTDLFGRFARAAGLTVGVAGNLGVPVFADGWDAEARLVVLEVSSYQAADLHHPPDVAVLTHLSEDHLSWHGGLDRYVADKLRVLRNDGGTAGRILLPPEDVGGRAGEAVRALGLTYESIVAPVDEPGASAVPVHRLQNAALAAAAFVAAGGPAPSAAAVVEAARSSLPGRLDECAGPAGWLCLDDALASNPSGAAAGLAWVRRLGRPTVVLLGGADRGVDPAPLVDEAARWPAGRLRAVTLPENGATLATAAGIAVVGAAADPGDAVAVARRALGVDGDAVVLFSPGAPTPSGSGSWIDRSAAFRAALEAARGD